MNEKFFSRPALVVARDLLGKFLVIRHSEAKPKNLIKAMITETEAYEGFEDKASHAHRGLTKRNFPMFGPAGRWYVYFTYGIHWMLNIVTGKKGHPSAVLIRGAIIADDYPSSLRGAKRRGNPSRVILSKAKNLNGPVPLEVGRPKVAVATRQRRGRLLTGPGKLTKFFKIDKRFNNLPATSKTGLWITAPKPYTQYPKPSIQSAARIGVSYAGLHWSRKKWRFYLDKF